MTEGLPKDGTPQEVVKPEHRRALELAVRRYGREVVAAVVAAADDSPLPVPLKRDTERLRRIVEALRACNTHEEQSAVLQEHGLKSRSRVRRAVGTTGDLDFPSLRPRRQP